MPQLKTSKSLQTHREHEGGRNSKMVIYSEDFIYMKSPCIHCFIFEMQSGRYCCSLTGVYFAINYVTKACGPSVPSSPPNKVTHKPVSFLMGFQRIVVTQLVMPPTPSKSGTFPGQNA